jgi:Fe-S cluster assembly iron-binding protein IscA
VGEDKAAAVKDVEVMAAAKSVDLVDNRVVGFSETQTALRFTRRRP